MPVARDLYTALGVPDDASDEQIKRAYRDKARRWHPDANPGDPEAEERFKEVSHAHDILSDPERRAEYDNERRYQQMYGSAHDAPPGGFGATHGATGYRADGFDLGSIFGSMFSSSGAHAPLRGQDLFVDVPVEWLDAFRGTHTSVLVSHADGGSETHRVRIPAGARTGTRVRLRGKGGPGAAGGPPGDLEARVVLKPHRVFGRGSRGDVTIDAPITIGEAVLGGKIEIPLPSGGRATLTVPPGSADGKVLRLSGKGAPLLSGEGTGDLLVTLRVVIPSRLDEKQRDALERYARVEDTDVRKDLLK